MGLRGSLSQDQWHIVAQTVWPGLDTFKENDSFFSNQAANSNLPDHLRTLPLPQYALYIGDEFPDIYQAPGIITEISLPTQNQLLCGFWLLKECDDFDGLVGSKEEFLLLGKDPSLFSDVLSISKQENFFAQHPV